MDIYKLGVVVPTQDIIDKGFDLEKYNYLANIIFDEGVLFEVRILGSYGFALNKNKSEVLILKIKDNNKILNIESAEQDIHKIFLN
jgi:hypothetical protein